MERSFRDLPARPGRLRTRFDLSGSRLIVQYRRFDATGCFLLLWLIGWTVGCAFLLRLVMAEPKLSHVLFAIPFWASWIFVSCLVLNSLFRKECLELGPEGIQFVCRVLVPIHRRAIPLDELQGFASYSTVTDSESNTRQWGLAVRTDGQELRFGQGIPDEERVWLIDQLGMHLSRLAPDRRRPRTVARPASDPEPLEDREDDDSSSPSEGRSGERLTMAAMPLVPPSDGPEKGPEKGTGVFSADAFHQEACCPSKSVLITLVLRKKTPVPILFGTRCASPRITRFGPEVASLFHHHSKAVKMAGASHGGQPTAPQRRKNGGNGRNGWNRRGGEKRKKSLPVRCRWILRQPTRRLRNRTRRRPDVVAVPQNPT